MSLGGNFFAMTDKQLQSLLDGSLELDFLYGDLAEKPREVYAQAEWAWLDIIRVVEDDTAGLAEQTNDIPETSQYSWAAQVKKIAPKLAALDDVTFESRYGELDGAETGPEELKKYIDEVVGFFQRAAQHGDAVLFRVT